MSTLQPTPTTKRFHVVVESESTNLQNERSMFEVTERTTLRELKKQIIARNDEGSVTRTFLEQIQLVYGEDRIPSTPYVDGLAVYHLFRLSRDVLAENNNIVKVKVSIHEHPNGSGGILSREFWRDVQSEDRFEFLPNTVSTNENTDVSTALSTSTTTTPPIAAIEPTKIVVQDGGTWEIQGTTYETLVEKNAEKESKTKIVTQDDLCGSEYVFKLEIDGVLKEVALNTSQCIVVDNGNHDPYILLNPSGTAKLNSVFRSASGESLMQKVQVMMYNEPPPARAIRDEIEEEDAQQPDNDNEDDIVERLIQQARRFGVNIFKIGVVLFLLGVRPNKHFMQHWFKYGVLFILLFNAYVLLFTGRNRIMRVRGNFTMFNNVSTTVVRRAVRRTTDRELALSRGPNWWKNIRINVENVVKDSVLVGLSIIPTFQDRINEELDTWELDTSAYEELLEEENQEEVNDEEVNDEEVNDEEVNEEEVNGEEMNEEEVNEEEVNEEELLEEVVDEQEVDHEDAI